MRSWVNRTVLIGIGLIASGSLGCRTPVMLEPFPTEPYRDNPGRVLEWKSLIDALPADVNDGPPGTHGTAHWCIPVREEDLTFRGAIPLTRQWIQDSDRTARANNELR